MSLEKMWATRLRAFERSGLSRQDGVRGKNGRCRRATNGATAGAGCWTWEGGFAVASCPVSISPRELLLARVARP